MFWFSFKRFRVQLIIAILIAALAAFLVPTDAKEIVKDKPPVSYKYDLVVYGGTPSGVMAALAAKRMGLRVVLVSASETVGGAMSNGVNATDLIKPGIIGGIPREYFDLVQEASGKKGSYRVSATTAERVFLDMLTKAEVEVRLSTELLEATVTGSKITCLRMTTAENFCANEFIDASYTGDLMPLTKTAFNLGRKDLFKYNDYQQMKLQQNEAFASNPVRFIYEALLPALEHKFSSQFREISQESIKNYEGSNYETKFMAAQVKMQTDNSVVGDGSRDAVDTAIELQRLRMETDSRFAKMQSDYDRELLKVTKDLEIARMHHEAKADEVKLTTALKMALLKKQAANAK
jgi:hypothetical protein